jgi:ubiquitin carboxyl-terminal hydrolase 9/24
MTSGVVQIDDCLLEGHLGVTKELVAMQSVQKKFSIGAENGGCNMIKVNILVRM